MIHQWAAAAAQSAGGRVTHAEPLFFGNSPKDTRNVFELICNGSRGAEKRFQRAENERERRFEGLRTCLQGGAALGGSPGWAGLGHSRSAARAKFSGHLPKT